LLSLIFIIMISVISGITTVVQDIETALLWPVALWGMLIGWLLAWSGIPGRWSLVINFVIGLLIIILQAGQLGGPVWRFIWAVINFLRASISENLSPDIVSMQLAWSEIAFISGDVFQRLSMWVRSLIQRAPNLDVVVITWIWSWVIWITSAWASWSIRRLSKPLWAIVPAAVVVSVVLTYTVGRGILLVPIMGATLALLGIVTHDERVKKWERSGIDYAATIREEMTLVILGISFAAMVISLIVPSVSISSIFRPVRDFLQEQVEERENLVRSLGLEPYRGGDGADLGLAAGVTGLPRSHLIGSGPELSKQVVMVVFVTSGWIDADARNAEPLYWRSLTFDEYNGAGWSSGRTRSRSYQAGEKFAFDRGDSLRAITQEVRVKRDQGGLLYAAGGFSSADQPFRAVWRRPENEGEFGEYLPDLIGVTVDASSYRVQSYVPIFSQDSLQKASQDYPQWVKDRYLVLPEDVPQRVHDLASDLTNSYETAYEKAVSIESYLRSFTYTLDLPAPPEDKDVADYFLFELQRGYCDYYATAMVVLSRSAGIPARLATGFASGIYDQTNDRFIVTEANAHSWVEVFFPEVGWVPFEPTAGLPEIVRPEAPIALPAELEEPPEAFSQTSPGFRWSFSSILFLFVGCLLILMILWDRLEIWLLRRSQPEVAVAKIYQRLYKFSDLLGVAVSLDRTPYEFARQFIDHIQTFVTGSRWESSYQVVYWDIYNLTDCYIQSEYSPRPLTIGDHIRLIKHWVRLRRRLVITLLGYRLSMLFRGE
jgi:hypothetical protein